KMRAGAAAVLEKHGFAHGQPHDVFHRVAHALDKAGATLWILVLRWRPFGFAGLAIVKIISGAAVLAHTVLMIQSNVEPDRRIKGAMLVQAEPGQFVVESLRSFFIGEVAIRDSPVGDRARDPMNKLPHRHFSSAFVWIGPLGDVAVELF